MGKRASAAIEAYSKLPAVQMLTSEEQLAAVYEASGRFNSLKEIAEHFNRPAAWIYKLREKQLYKDLVKATLAQIAERITREAADFTQMFDQQIQPSVRTLAEIRDNPFAKDSDRLKAATTLIDRAPSAPKVKAPEAAQSILSLPVVQMKMIKEALVDSDEGDLVELLEGEGYEVEEQKDEDELVVKRID